MGDKVKTIKTFKEFEDAIEEAFDDLQKPTELYLNIQKDPVRSRDQYFFNNGVKAVMWSSRASVDTSEAKLKIALEAFNKLMEDDVSDYSSNPEKNPQFIVRKAISEISKVKFEDYR